MDNSNIAKVIKELRQQNNLTQKQFADQLSVTFQAVSKWENGKNIPDIAILKQIAEEFNVDLESLLNGVLKQQTKKEKNNKKTIIIIILICLTIGLSLFFILKDDSLILKLISTDSNDFTVNGCVVFNSNASSIYVSNIEYTGKENEEVYKEITFNLYEKNKDQLILIDEHHIINENNSLFKDLIKEVSFNIVNYEASCKSYESNDLYIEAIAMNEEAKTNTFQIPFTFTEGCICENEQ